MNHNKTVTIRKIAKIFESMDKQHKEAVKRTASGYLTLEESGSGAKPPTPDSRKVD